MTKGEKGRNIKDEMSEEEKSKLKIKREKKRQSEWKKTIETIVKQKKRKKSNFHTGNIDAKIFTKELNVR